MQRPTRSLALALALTAASSGLARAQDAPLRPEPIAADAPTAVRARAVADLILAGDRQQLEAYLAAHGAAELTGAPTYAAELTELLEAAKTGARTVIQMDGLGPNRVGVALGSGPGVAPERAIIVVMEPAAPHRITRLRIVPIQMG